MDNAQAISIYIPFNTWGPKGQMILRLFDHLHENDVRYAEGGENELIERLQRLLFMAHRAVLDLIRSL